MGQRIDRAEWDEELEPEHRPLLSGLEAHLESKVYSLKLLGWFNDGRSGSPVARVMRSNDSHQLILKFCESAESARNLALAREPRIPFVDRHLAELEGDPFIIGTGPAHGQFMRIAGGDLEEFRSMAALRHEHPATSHIDYGSIVASVIGQWNEGRVQHAERTARSVVSGIVGYRRDQVIRWIRAAGDRISREPMAFLTQGEPNRWVVKDLLIGRAHGDLTGRNILMRAANKVVPDDFQLIDYDHYTQDAVLARDPMHLLVALALDDFDSFDLGRAPTAHADLIKVIVDPDGEGISPVVGYFRKISAAMRTGAVTGLAKRSGLGPSWRQQCLLALVGEALLRVGRTIRTVQPEVARRWCYDLAVAAAARYRDEYPGTGAPGVPAARSSAVIIDRHDEWQPLTDRLVHGPHGILSVRGRTGVGKSKLVDAVVEAIAADCDHRRRPRVERRQARPDYLFGLPTLIELISGHRPDLANSSGAALVQLEALLATSRDPVIIAIDSAEHLLDPDTHRLVDLGIDEAFTILSADDRHRVSVVLETRDGEAFATAGAWPDEDAVTVPELEQDDFIALLRGLDPDDRFDLESLSLEQRHELWERAKGIPRIGELLYATVCHADRSLPALLAELRNHPSNSQAFLMRILVDNMHPLKRDILRALAVLDTPVPAAAVQTMLSGCPPKRVETALRNLQKDHLLRRTSQSEPEGTTTPLFFLPDADAEAVRDGISDAGRRRRLLHAAGAALRAHQVATPRNVADLRYHLAELRIAVLARSFPYALWLIDSIDAHLRAWNCSRLLLRQRLAVRGQTASLDLERQNENALGGIYVDIGDFTKAHAAYDRALALTGPDADPSELARLHANRAELHLSSNDVELAWAGHKQALLQARAADDVIAEMAALNGLARCHRQRGEFRDAIALATVAFGHTLAPTFADRRNADVEGQTLAVALAARLSRWHAELHEPVPAHRWLGKIWAIAQQTGDWHLATYFDALADLLLYQHLQAGEVEMVIDAAGRAVDLAFKLQDRVVLLQARTTLCVAQLSAGRIVQAATTITRAGWHRPRGRHLVVLGLTALTTRLTGHQRAAEKLFDDLRGEAEERIASDAGMGYQPGGEPARIGGVDFGARHFHGLALCGLVLTGRADINAAVDAFRMPDIVERPHAPGLTERMAFMLGHLDASAEQSGVLRPAIDALRAG